MSGFSVSLKIGAALAGSFGATLASAEQQLTRLGKAAAAAGDGPAAAGLRTAELRLQTSMASRQANLANRADLQNQLLGAAAKGLTLAVPVRIAANFEQAMARTGAVAGLDLAGEEFKRLTATARELGATTNWSASEAAEGMQYLAMAGFKTNEMVAAMPGMLSLASAGAIDLGSAADIASNILSGFKMEAGEMGRLGDVLTNTFTTSNTSLGMLGETMKYVAPVAQSLGVSVELAAAMTGKLGDVGIQGSQAGTALRGMLSRLSAPTGEAARTLRELGVATKDAEGNLRDMPTILAELDQAMSRMGSGDKAAAMKHIFGEEAVSAATELMSQAASGSLQAYAESLKKTGTAAEVAQKQNDTLTGRFKQLGSATQDLAISVGDILKPAIGWMAETLTSAAGGVRRLTAEYPGLTRAVVFGVGGLLAFGTASVGLRYAFTFLKGGFLNAKVAVDAFRGGLALLKGASAGVNLAGIIPNAGRVAGLSGAFTNLGGVLPMVAGGIKAIGLALVTNPIGLAVMAIAGAALVIWKYWGPIKSFFVGLWQGISAAAAPAVAAVTSALEGLRSIPGVEWAIGLLGQLWGWIKTIGSGIGNFFSTLFTQDAAPSAEAQSMGQAVGAGLVNGIKFAFLNFTPMGWVIQAWGPVSEWFSGLGERISGVFNGVGAVFSGVGAAVTGVFNGVGAAITGVFNQVSQLGASIGQGISAAFAAVLQAVTAFDPVAAFSAVFDRVRAYLSSIDLGAAGRAILETLKQGILSAAGAVVDAVKGVFDRVKALLPSSDAKEGPLSALTASGRAIPVTVGQGIAAAGATPLTAPLTRAFGAAQGLLDSPLAASLAASLGMDTARPPQSTMSAGMSGGVQALLAPGAGGTGGAGPGTGAGGAIVVHYAPTINLTGDGAGAPQALQAGLQQSHAELRRMLDDLMHQQRRTSFA